MKEQIAVYVREIDELNKQIAEHWSRAQKFVAEDQLDQAISILNAYFRIKTKLNGVENRLEGILKGYFSAM